MRLVFISSCNPVDCYIIAAVRARWPLTGLVRPWWGAKPSTVPRSPARRHLLRAAHRRITDAWYRRYFARLDAEIARILFGPAPVPMPPSTVDVSAWAIHEPPTVDLIRGWRPDVLIVSGGPILKPVLYSAARVRLNVHFGLTSAYRGHHTIFWPLRLGDYANIGGTLHHLEETVDGGAAIGRVYPALERVDTEATLLAKCARMLASLLVEFLEAVEHGDVVSPAPRQGVLGRLVRYGDRGFRHELLFAWRRRVLRRGPSPRAARVERYF